MHFLANCEIVFPAGNSKPQNYQPKMSILPIKKHKKKKKKKPKTKGHISIQNKKISNKKERNRKSHCHGKSSKEIRNVDKTKLELHLRCTVNIMDVYKRQHHEPTDLRIKRNIPYTMCSIEMCILVQKIFIICIYAVLISFECYKYHLVCGD